MSLQLSKESKRWAGAGALVVCALRALYKKWADSRHNRLRRFHERFGTPDQGCFMVTGASSGLGEAIAIELSETYGYDLILVARRESNLATLAKQLATKCVPLPTDLQSAFHNEDGIVSFRRRLEAALPAGKTLAGCVHMAGNSDLAVHAMTDKTPARNLDMLDLNCRGTLGTLQAIVPLLAGHVASTKRRSVAVTPGALTGFVDAAPTFSTSSANKNYVRSLTLSCRYEYEKDGIDFVCACPVAVRSEILDNADTKDAPWYQKFIHIPTGAEWSRGVIADLALGLAETNGRYMDWLANFMTYAPGWMSRKFFQDRVQSNAIILNREIDLRPLRDKVDWKLV